jgi:3',5'-cyclic-AMP phosphodiesterase
MTSEVIRFVLVSDTHIDSSKEFEFEGRNSYELARRFVRCVKELSFPPDFVIHAGDVTQTPNDESYAIAREVFQDLPFPMYYAVGNHDKAEKIVQWLSHGERATFPISGESNYVFDLKGVRFFVLDGRGEDGIDPRGEVSKPALEALQRELEESSLPVCVVSHFPAVPLLADWMDANMLLLNGEEVHTLLKKGKDNLLAYFHGHVHQYLSAHCDGVYYSSVPSTVMHFKCEKTDEEPRRDFALPPAYQIVTIRGREVRVQTKAIE